MAKIILFVAILTEVVATSALKASAGFTRPVATVAALLLYAVAFYCLSVTLKTIPMGVVYAIWSGVGIVLISLVGLVVYKQRLDGAALAGIGLIIVGVIVLNLFSKGTIS